MKKGGFVKIYFPWVGVLAGLATLGQDVSSLYHQAPEDWRSEVIALPLAFAPELALTGREELRFAPGMYDAEAEDYFSYSFIWWLEGRVEITPAMLEKNLKGYFVGLYKAVSKKTEKKTEKFRARVRATREPAWIAGAVQNFRATIRWVDPFVTEKELTLHMKIAQWYCPEKKHTVVFFLVSPKAGDHGIWKTLQGMKAGRCRE